MAQRISRKALYNMVWSKPLSRLGPEFGISDTALRKRCKKAFIPLPTAGYWAKKAANKSVHQPPLPPRFPGNDNHIEIGACDYWQRFSREVIFNNPIPPPPEFDTSLESIRNTIIKLVGKVSYPSLNSRPHPLITKLINEDTARIKEISETGYSWLKARFTTAIQKRRLRIINALFLGANKVFGKPSISINKYDEDLGNVSIQFGERYISITLNSVVTKKTINKKVIENTHLKLSLDDYSYFDMEIPYWEDSESDKVEDNVTDIIIDMLMGSELKYRTDEQRNFDRFIKYREQYIEEDRQQKIEEERLEKEEAGRLQQARIDELLMQADNLQKAQTIRHYVAAIEHSSDEFDIPSEKVLDWCLWAKEQANTLDPILQMAFLKQIQEDN